MRATRMAIAFVVLLSQGCATILQGRYQEVDVTAGVDSARVYLDGQQVATAPATLTVRRNGPSSLLRIEKNGYSVHETELSRRLSPMLLSNLPVGLLLTYLNLKLQGERHAYGAFAMYVVAPIGIDFLTGAAFERKPRAIDVRLERREDAVPGDAAR